MAGLVTVNSCPVCGAMGTFLVYVTGHPLIVHPGKIAPDGSRFADGACILTDEQVRALAIELTVATAGTVG